MNIIFFGGSSFTIPIVNSLNKLFNLSKVIVKNENDQLVDYCKKNNIPYFVIRNSNELEKIIKDTTPVIGITANFGMIFPNSILNLFPNGVLNIHPSLLPKFRGPTPVQTAILNGEKITGVTLFKLDEKIDHGPIIAQEEFEIPENFTSEDLLNALFKLGAKLLEDNLEDYFNSEIILTEQNDNEASNTNTLKKENGFISFDSNNNHYSIINIQRMIRAFFPWPGVWTKFDINGDGKEKIIKILPDNMVQVEGKNPVNYKNLKNGYKNAEELLKKLKLS